MSIEKRREEFDVIDKDKSGIIEFKEWYKHFDALIRKENSTWTAEKLLKMYKEFEGDTKGIDFEEYCTFMDEVFEKPRAAARERAKERAIRKGAFQVIDKDGSGIIEFKEWYKHFDALIREKDSTWTAEKLLVMYQAYEGDDKGINFEEYSTFMDDVFGK